MKHFYLLFSLLLGLGNTSLKAQNRLNVHFQSNLPYSNDLNDIWGYADTAGNEYALVGVRTGFSVIDVTDPSNPVEKFFIPGAFSVWRDIKTWNHYAYVVHDGFFSGTSDGIMIVDMDSVNEAKPAVTRFYPSLMIDTNVSITFNRAHNIYIDENGILYVFGSNLGVGGALMFDLSQDPENPVYVGNWNEQYLHDGVARGDTLWGAAVLAGNFYAVDVSIKSLPLTMGSQSTPSSFTHNIWFSDDNKTVFTTDEIAGAFVTSYDVSDLNNIRELDRIRTSYGGADVIPHNAHVYGDFVVNSYYSSGLQVLDATYPDIMIEVGYYDTSDSVGDGFNGAWGAYPYLPSGNVLISDIQEGLFVLSADYLKGCYLDVEVVDSLTKQGIPGAQVEVLASAVNEQASIFGKLRTGFEAPGTYDMVVSKPGYITDTVEIVMNRGVMLNQRVALLPFGFSLAEDRFAGFSLYPNPSENTLILEVPATRGSLEEVRIYDLNGKEVYRARPNQNKYTLQHSFPKGVYLVEVMAHGEWLIPQKLIVQ